MRAFEKQAVPPLQPRPGELSHGGRVAERAIQGSEGLYASYTPRRVDDTHIVVAMDNNLPFSSGRKLDRAADNEFILLAVPELLSTR